MTTVRRTLDPKKPPKLSDEAKARYDAMPDEAIDYSETPDLDDVDWKALKVDMPRAKPTVTMRLEEDVIGFFKDADPKGYTGRMAAVLTARAHQPK
jgi:uncharacterized protein (DUF4415 family)